MFCPGPDFVYNYGIFRGEASLAILSFLAALAALCLPSSLTYLLTHCYIHCYGFKAFRPFRPNRNPAKLIGVIRKHDLTTKKTTTKTNTKTMTNTFRESKSNL